MDENSLTETILRTAVLILIVSGVVLLGWNEPIKYRFMSREEIYALENPQPPRENSGAWMWEKSQGSLDRGAYNRSGGKSSASSYWKK